ncbi:putative membrane protein YesL [Chryseobacterium sp. SORGH_AS909]|uniref:Membrane protein YesL n=1 Tax=Chryseobacterium camelliae TaxID=1265445 RepID=A0ABU0TKV5_9FLAO|nr:MULTISPECIES: hypothetical protein [Chryseobacterium]MDT3408469.1 putative membrane protein YesL [Pseudacidovorax intermedius]MDQ1097675.1 putative membrane protein YesL [Chryseobacterium camelliae]MDQ1101604.1 putative membrane protein YesL [Chryseobacterium sp. SORGH_AS_1048]MDR6085047.1 putative membrane protein YesL [Chryseobacterium sp. SORGH_AS_0909]MDR6129402.1 putative membrane protein YesL [Chryseobacterium sp. SORGH_AS_1175]
MVIFRKWIYIKEPAQFRNAVSPFKRTPSGLNLLFLSLETVSVIILLRPYPAERIFQSKRVIIRFPVSYYRVVGIPVIGYPYIAY